MERFQLKHSFCDSEENLRNNLLSGGIDLSTGDSAAAIIIGGTEQLKYTSSYLDQAFDQLSKMLRPNSVVHRGIYSGDKPSLNVFSAIGGLGKTSRKIKSTK